MPILQRIRRRKRKSYHVPGCLGGDCYCERPQPAAAALVLSREARIAVMRQRVAAELSPYHPGDLWRRATVVLKVGVEARHNSKNGADMDGPVVVLGKGME